MTDEMPPERPRRASPRRRRLSRSAEFERVYRQGRSKANRFLVLYAFPRDVDAPPRAGEEGGPRLGLSVSRRVGGAVDRSLVKRLLREAFWAECSRLPAGSDYVIVARPESRGLAEREALAGIRPALAELVDGFGGGAARAATAPAPRGAPPPDAGGGATDHAGDEVDPTARREPLEQHAVDEAEGEAP